MFPEYRELITSLKGKDAHFTRLFNEHNELDEKIAELEKNPVTAETATDEIHKLKVHKLALKDQLHDILKKAAAAQ